MTTPTSLATLPSFPFAALSGQPTLQQALLLAAVDPAVGGVLVTGPRGTAKSTAARGLAELLPDPVFVTLPLGASLEHLVGTLDLGAAMSGHALRFSPGLLARAHGGVLYVDEVNLLPDALVDALLDAAASGQHTVERDGISHTHPARVTLVGTMNPEEGELRPQLLDRFGLCVRLGNVDDRAQRQAIVRARLAFDADPLAFRARHAAAQADLAARLLQARVRLAGWPLDAGEAVHARVADHCLAAGVDGLRADLAMLRAARALAAWEQAAAVAVDHVDRVAGLVLAHRRTTATDTPPPASGRPSDAPPPPAHAAGDWGALPPEPVGLVPVDLHRPPDRPDAPLPKKA